MPSRCKHSWSPTLLGKRAHDAGDLGQQLVSKKAQYRRLTPPGPIQPHAMGNWATRLFFRLPGERKIVLTGTRQFE